MDNDTITTSKFQSLNELRAVSDIIDDETFELKFLVRVLPDNGWYLKLNKDSTYAYTHWSAWGDSDGTILEKGKYEIVKNKIKLYPHKKKSELAKSQFYLVTSESNEIDDNITIDCVETESKIYCLYQK